MQKLYQILGRRRFMGTLLVLLGGLAARAQQPIWSDEFDGQFIDKSVWMHETGGDGNGNGELQYYTASTENAYLEDGNLVIEARRENYEGNQFTSARLKTHGRFTFKYGTLEARIKLPDVANGLWPAFWMMGDNIGQVGWPYCGETDILEVGWKSALDDGTANQSVSAATHWWHETGDWGDWLQADLSQHYNIGENFYDDYHIFKIEWTPDYMNISVDDHVYFSQGLDAPELSEFVENPNFILLNLAVGGFNFVEITDPGQITAPFPAKMYVDYVRLYENEFTETYTAEELAHRGPYGVYTDLTAVNESLNFGTSTTNLYVWNNMETVATTPAEGSGVFSYTVAPGAWWGMGLAHLDQNMQYYKNGYLHFQCKTDYQGAINVSIASSGADGSGIDLVTGGEEYGLVRDGEWHEVAIPLHKFSNVDFNTVKALFQVSGGDPGTQMNIAFDDIYWTESIALPTPEFGNYGVYTENTSHSDAGVFGFGVNGDLFLWENTLEVVPTTPAEGNSSLSFTSTGAGWYGMGLTARVPHNLSAFDNANGAFHFSMKTSSTADFRIGMKSGQIDNLGQKWIWFRNGSDPYGFARDGQWHEIVIPISEIVGDVDLMNMTQMFQLLGIGEISDIAFDDVYFSGGEEATDPGTNEPPINRAPSAAIVASVSGGPAPLAVAFDGSQSYDVNGDALTYAWDFGDGTTATGVTANHTFTENGSYTVTLTVADSLLSDETTYTIFVNDNFGSVKSTKRGLGYGQHSEADLAALAPGISWWYNWGTQPEPGVADIHLNYGVDYVPMAWNGGFNEQDIINWLNNHPEAEYILGWNEPNFLDQANMTPSQAAAEWPRLEAIADQFGLKIVSPAMNYCGNCVTENGTTYYDPIEYMDDFFAACSGCQVDAISIHSYMGTAGAFEWYVGLFKQYNLPIWVTEFCNWEHEPTLEDQKRYMIHSVDYLENDPDVEKYAWFIGRHQGFPYMALLEPQSGVLSELGQMYINMPVHDPSIYYSVPGLVEAENYATMSGIRPEQTQDTNGFLNLSEIEAGDWVEYSLASAGGTYQIDLRVASDSLGGSVNILVDGVQQGTVSFGVTGGWQTWQDHGTTVTIPAGNHTLRLEAASGVFNINYFNVGNAASPNEAPVANAGADQNLAYSVSSTALDGVASSDPDSGPSALSYSWSQTAGPTVSISNASIVNPTISGLSSGNSYTFQLIVNDGQDDSDPDFVTVNVAEEPQGCGGANLALNKPAVSSSQQGDFAAGNAFDADGGTRWGSDFNDDEWIRVDLEGTYNICQVILQWEGAFGSDYEIRLGSSTDLNASTVIATVNGGDGGEDVVTTNAAPSGRYLWMRGLARGTGWGYSLWEMEVFGGSGTPQNTAPTANAGADQNLAAGTTSANLSGSGVDADGDAITYSWSQTAGPVVSIASPTSANTAVSGLASGQSYTFQLITNDGQENSDPDQVTITVADDPQGCGTTNIALNKPAVASTQEGDYGAANAFDGNGGTRWGSAFNDDEWIRVDLEGTFNICQVTLQWEGAYGSDYEIRLGTSTDLNAATVIATVNGGNGGEDVIQTDATASGRYLWMLGLARGTGWGYSLWEMQVFAGSSTPVNTAPVAYAGTDQNHAAGTTSTMLNGSGSDADGDPLTYSWLQVAGPAANISDVNAQSPTVSGLVNGASYTFHLVVDDGTENSVADEVVITIDEAVVDCNTNVALNQPAVSSSQEGGFTAANAFDGIAGSRWASNYNDDEWIRVDLGAVHAVCSVVLTWETAYGSAYEIRIGNSTDLNASSVIATVSNGDGGIDDVTTDQNVTGRYIWMRGIARGTGWGYSLYEMEVYGSATGARMSGSNMASDLHENRDVAVNLSLYPNPASESVFVKMDKIFSGDKLQVISVTGQLQMEINVTKETHTVDISGLESGMYILRYAGSSSENIRFIKQ